jgi:phenylalanyl-tRNA synthetase beta chain
MLGIALCGVKSWLTLQGAAKENLGMPHLKGIIETLCRRLGIGDCAFRVSAQAGAAEIFLKEACLGRAFSPDKGILDKLEIKNKQAVVAEIYLEKLIARACPERRFNPLPLYPAISRDLSIVVKEEISAQQVLDLLRAKAGALLEEARVSDYYRGKQIPPGFKGLTISCLYRSPERTLREEEVLPLQQAVLQALENEFGARLR